MLSPETLHALRNLPLAAKQAAEGFLAGHHRSRRRGVGMEFSQYRPYQPGDDLRRLDWRLAARSDRYYIRESEVETSLMVHLLLDASASMNHRDDNGLTKLDYARLVLASMAYLASNQGDAVALSILRPEGVQHLPPRAEYAAAATPVQFAGENRSWGAFSVHGYAGSAYGPAAARAHGVCE